MNRSRMIGVLAILAASFTAAGCGGGGNSEGHVASQEAPAPAAPADGTAAPAETANPADEARSKALGAFPPAAEGKATLKDLSRFDRSRAGNIFQPPASVASARATDAPAAPATGSDTQPVAPATSGQAPADPATPAEPEKAADPEKSGDQSGDKKSNDTTASLDVDGTPVFAKVGTQIPSQNPLFTVESVTADKTVLKLNSGSFPGGSSTVDIAKGASVTLSNPASGNTVVIKVLDIGAK